MRHIYLAAYSGNIKDVRLTQSEKYEASVKGKEVVKQTRGRNDDEGRKVVLGRCQQGGMRKYVFAHQFKIAKRRSLKKVSRDESERHEITLY